MYRASQVFTHHGGAKERKQPWRLSQSFPHPPCQQRSFVMLIGWNPSVVGCGSPSTPSTTSPPLPPGEGPQGCTAGSRKVIMKAPPPPQPLPSMFNEGVAGFEEDQEETFVLLPQEAAVFLNKSWRNNAMPPRLVPAHIHTDVSPTTLIKSRTKSLWDKLFAQKPTSLSRFCDSFCISAFHLEYSPPLCLILILLHVH